MNLFRLDPNGNKIKKAFICCACWSEVTTDFLMVDDGYFAYCPDCDHSIKQADCTLVDVRELNYPYGKTHAWWHCPSCNTSLETEPFMINKGFFAHCTDCETDYHKDQCKLVLLKHERVIEELDI